ncbi:hypothetical protein NG726_26005 [Pseudomonas sp. MOB-449]|nr:hypothetical protein [Pseudomonas sp. MOB-449]
MHLGASDQSQLWGGSRFTDPPSEFSRAPLVDVKGDIHPTLLGASGGQSQL